MLMPLCCLCLLCLPASACLFCHVLPLLYGGSPRPAHLHHAEVPLLAQHARLVLDHVAEGGLQQLALTGNASVEGHTLRVGSQPRLRGGKQGRSTRGGEGRVGEGKAWRPGVTGLQGGT